MRTSAGGDSILLPTLEDGAITWSAYSSQFSRGDATARPLLSGLEIQGMPHRPSDGHTLVLANDEGVWLAASDGDPTSLDTLPDLGLMGPADASGPWLVGQRRSNDGNLDLYRGHRRTGELQRLTSDPLDEGWPWLRGDSVVFGRGRMGADEDGSLELFLLDYATGEEHQLTDNDWNDYELSWSSDGQHICWQSEEHGHYQSEIMVMDLRTRRSWNLSDSPGRDFGCAFTPDGTDVLYNSLRTGNPDLMIQPLHGGPAVNLSDHPDQDVLVGFVRR